MSRTGLILKPKNSEGLYTIFHALLKQGDDYVSRRACSVIRGRSLFSIV